MKHLTAFAPLLLLFCLAGPAQANDSPEQVARTFYDAFVTGDMDTMERLYHEDVSFEDPIFSYSDRDGVMGMWRLILSPDQGGTFSYSVVGVEGNEATVLWIADYELFGRPIHNEITATLTVEDGKITDHRDVFSWSKWSRQALPLGPVPNWMVVRPITKWLIRSFTQHQIDANEARRRKQAANKSGGLSGGLQVP